MPEQTWRGAWEGMPPKKSHIYLPLGLDGGRQRFELHADGSVRFRSNDHFLRGRPGKETPRFALEPAPVRFRFLPPLAPMFRTIEEACMPIGHTVWETNGVRISRPPLRPNSTAREPMARCPRPTRFTVCPGEIRPHQPHRLTASRHPAADLPDRRQPQGAPLR